MKKKAMPIVVLAADHAGYEIKVFVKSILEDRGYQIEDMGTFSTESVDYPEYTEKLALQIVHHTNKVGILMCGTGIGASIAVNKIPGIRAALVKSEQEAALSVEHNKANVLVLGGRPFIREEVRKIISRWFQAEFQGGRHQRRVQQIEQIEAKYLQTNRSHSN